MWIAAHSTFSAALRFHLPSSPRSGSKGYDNALQHAQHAGGAPANELMPLGATGTTGTRTRSPAANEFSLSDPRRIPMDQAALSEDSGKLLTATA